MRPDRGIDAKFNDLWLLYLQPPNKQYQSGSTAQFFTARAYLADLQFTFAVSFAVLGHRILHLLGFAYRVFVLVIFNKYINKLNSNEGLFLLFNRLS